MGRKMKVTATATKVKITPKLATELLDKHEALVKERGGESLNRNINDNLVAKYAGDIKAGNWLLNGETIKIAATGRILDGQHRLWAAANHDVTFETMVVSGLDEEAFYTIDIGRSRKAADFLMVDGVKYGPAVAAAARFIIGYRSQKLHLGHMLTTPMILEFCKANPGLEHSAAVAYNAKNIVSPSVGTAWHFMFSETSIEAADKFMNDLRDGIGLQKGDPLLALRERLIKNKSATARLTSREILILGVRAWNDRRQGRSRSIVKVLPQNLSDTKLPKVA